jgi:hypothetical protein
MEDIRYEAGPGHEWGEWAPANIGLNSCEFINSQIRFCDVCDKYEVKSDEGPGHAWDDDSWYQTNIEECMADCTVDAEFERVCPVCACVETKVEANKGHKWGKWTEADLGMNTCEFTNGQIRYCSVCGKYEIKFDKGEGHQWGDWAEADLGLSACEAVNCEMRSCTVCGKKDTRYDEGPGHTWCEWDKIPNETDISDCVWDYEYVRHCDVCGAEGKYALTTDSSGSWKLDHITDTYVQVPVSERIPGRNDNPIGMPDYIKITNISKDYTFNFVKSDDPNFYFANTKFYYGTGENDYYQGTNHDSDNHISFK